MPWRPRVLQRNFQRLSCCSGIVPRGPSCVVFGRCATLCCAESFEEVLRQYVEDRRCSQRGNLLHDATPPGAMSVRGSRCSSATLRGGVASPTTAVCLSGRRRCRPRAPSAGGEDAEHDT